MLVQQTWQANNGIWEVVVIDFGLPYFSVSISLNVLLTLTIVIRLVLHSKDIRATLGTPGGISGLHKAAITMLIEPSALYAINSLLFIGLWVAGNDVAVSLDGSDLNQKKWRRHERCGCGPSERGGVPENPEPSGP